MIRHKIIRAAILTACLPFCCPAVDLLALPRAEFAKYYEQITGRAPVDALVTFAIDANVLKKGPGGRRIALE